MGALIHLQCASDIKSEVSMYIYLYKYQNIFCFYLHLTQLKFSIVLK